MVFWDVVSPVILIAILGGLLQKNVRIKISSFSKPVLHIMTPALIFTTFYKADLDITYFYILVHSFVLLALLMLLSKVVSLLMKLEQKEQIAFQLSTIFMNNGNLGLPIILFAFGDQALGYGIAVMLIQTLFMSTLGIYLAARGILSFKAATSRILKLPILHAAIFSFVLRHPNLPEIPLPVFNSLELISQAAIPAMIIILGMQIADTSLNQLKWLQLFMATTIRLIISPILALLITMFLPIPDLLIKVLIIQAAMPSAALITIYAIEYNCEPSYISSATLFNTLLSVGTITALLYII